MLSLRPFVRADGLLMRGQTVAATRLIGVEAEALLAYGDLLVPAVTDWNEQSLVLGAALALGLKQGDRVTFILPEDAESTYAPLTVTLTSILDSGTELDEVLALVHRRFITLYWWGQCAGLAVNCAMCSPPVTGDGLFISPVPSHLQVTDWRATHGNLYWRSALARS